ncbi:MAG: hypothetical protein PHF14_05770 [Verrucomicrobiota bacterium]|jgi:hypothetical protein|nr:hypothetical protein [Verrucomicrobiota bacterium]
MSRSGNILLFLLAVALFGAFFWLDSGFEAREEPTRTRLLPDFVQEEIQGIEVRVEDRLLRFQRYGGREWRVSGTGLPTRVLADAARMDRLMDGLEFAQADPGPGAMQVEQAISVSSIGLRMEGLTGSRDFTLELHRLLDGSEAVYLSDGHSVRGWLSDPESAKLLMGKVEAWIDPRLLPVDPVRVVRFGLENQEGRAELAIRGREWRYIQPVIARARQEHVAAFLERLSELKAPETGMSGASAPRGAGGGTLLFRALLWTDAFSGARELHVYESPGGEVWGDYDNGRRRVRFPDGLPDELRTDPMSFVPEHLVQFQSAAVLGIQFRSAEGGWLVQRATPDAVWRVESPYQAPAEMEVVRDILDVMGRLKVMRVIGSRSNPQAAEENSRPGHLMIRLMFAHKQAWDAIGGAPAEPALAIELERLQPDGLVGARQDEGVLYALDSDLVDDLGWPSELLRERLVHGAAIEAFSALHVRREDERLDWQEGDSSAAWVTPWLQFLTEVRAVRYLGRDPQRVSEYGLSQPELEIDWTLRLEDAVITHRLVFSGIDAAPLYGMLDESGWVFELDPDEAQALRLLIQQFPSQAKE